MISDFTKAALKFKRLAAAFSKPPPITPSPNEGVVMGLGENGAEVHWPKHTLEHAGHVALFGSSGSGKTLLVSRVIVEQVVQQSQEEPDHRAAIFIEDAKGDLVNSVLMGLAAEAPERLADVIHLDPFAASGFPFNLKNLSLHNTPVEVRATQIAETVSTLSTARGTLRHLGTGPRQQDLLENLILACLCCPHPRANVLMALDALLDRRGFSKLAAVTASARAKAFLQGVFVSEDLRASSAARLRSALAVTEQMEKIVGAQGCLQFEDLIRPGAIVLFRPSDPPGGLVSPQECWASLMIRLLIDFCMQRPSPWPGYKIQLYFDEAQVVAGVLAKDAERVLTLGRSKGLSLTVMSQGTRLLKEADEGLVALLMTNAPTKIVGRLASPDAELFARELAPRPGVDESISSFRSQVAAAVSNLPDRSFMLMQPGKRMRFTSRTIDLNAWEEAARARAGEIENLKRRTALPIDQPPRLTLQEAAAEERPRRTRRPDRREGGNAPPTTRNLWG